MFALSRTTSNSIIIACCLALNILFTAAIAAEQEKAANTEKPVVENDAAKTNNEKSATENSSNINENENKTSDKNVADNEANTSTEATEEKQTKRIINAPVDAFKQQQQDIKHYIKNDNVEAMLVGTDEFLILTDKHKTAINKGVIMLIPDWQQSAASPSAIMQIRQNMPEHGWTILTLHPPHQLENYPSRALTAEERLEQDKTSLTDYKQTLSAIVTELNKKAKNYPGAIITIAEGQHAALMVDMVQSKLIEPPSAMIMLSSYMPTITENATLAEQVAISDYPVFDLYLKRDHHLVLANAKNRKDRAKNEMKVYFRQKQLSNQVTAYYPKHSLTREIIGWLKSIGW